MEQETQNQQPKTGKDKKSKLKNTLIRLGVVFLLLVTFAGVNSYNDSTGYKIKIDGVYFCEYIPTLYSCVQDTKIENVSILTFKILNEYYAKDKNRVYNAGEVIKEADPITFKVLNENHAKDKNYVYYIGEVIKEADPLSFEVVDLIYAKDKNHVYFGSNIIKGADFSTFEVLHRNFSKDKNYVYYRGKLIEGADPLSFEVLNEVDSKDKNHVYLDGKIVEEENSTNCTAENLKGCETSTK